MNVKSLKSDLKRSQKSSVSQSQLVDEDLNVDDEMLDESEDKQVMTQQPQKRQSDETSEQSKVAQKRQVIQLPTVVLDGFTDKTEKQLLAEKIQGLGMILGTGLPSKLNNTSQGITIILSNNGNYEAPQNLKSTVFAVNK